MFDEDGARFSPQITKSKNCCCVKNCRSKASRDFTIRFHGFPKPGNDFVNITDQFGARVKVCRRLAWEQILKLERKKITDNTRVCSLHFRRSDYILPDAPTQKRYLKRDAVPSLNLQTAKGIVISPDSRLTNETSRRKDLVERRDSAETYINVEIKSELLETELQSEILDIRSLVQRDHCYTIPICMEQREANDGLAIKEEPREMEIKLEPPEINDDSTHEYDCPEEPMSLESLTIKEEPERMEIKFETVDLPDIVLNDHFQQIWEPSMTPQLTTERLENSQRTSIVYDEKATHTVEDTAETKFIDIIKTDRALNIITGIPSHDILRKIIDIFKASKPRYARATGLGITIVDRTIMTFTKLKQGLSYGVLAIFFKCTSKEACKRIILRTLDILGDCLKCFIGWDRQGNKFTRVPVDFAKFSNIHCLINRLEIAVRKSRDASSSRATTRSRYKRGHSVKFVIASRPDGTICFLSKACDGNNSHEEIFQRSGVMKLLRKNDAIMILKDFPIDDICRENSVRLVRSLFSRNNENLSDSTSYRVRLNVNRRIHRFRIFRRKLTLSLCQRAEKIVTIICAVENLQKSMLFKRETSIS